MIKSFKGEAFSLPYPINFPSKLNNAPEDKHRFDNKNYYFFTAFI